MPVEERTSSSASFFFSPALLPQANVPMEVFPLTRRFIRLADRQSTASEIHLPIFSQLGKPLTDCRLFFTNLQRFGIL